jgi:hypothetical protein
MPNPLPQFEASLSKYFRVEDHCGLPASISNDTPESELRVKFDTDLYVTARARYLIVKDKIVIRDKLIDLIHEEGGFTERVKMVMYFLFMFWDPTSTTGKGTTSSRATQALIQNSALAAGGHASSLKPR